jgi:probable H4MPT-linked C1 transfer pathway protein
VDSCEAKQNHLKVAAANWHALATLAGQYVPSGRGILLDVGSTTADIIPILEGLPVPTGKSDPERFDSGELVYTGVRRTPLCAIMGWHGAAELFATTHDVYLTLGQILEDPADCETADGRPATQAHARARLARMYGGDIETIAPQRIQQLAEWVHQEQLDRLSDCLRRVRGRLEAMPIHRVSPGLAGWHEDDLDEAKPSRTDLTYVVSGSGEFLARRVIETEPANAAVLALTDQLGPEISACAPAYAVAVLAAATRSHGLATR